MRNIFDQYNQPENRLTHSLACTLHHDQKLLKSFLATFGPKPYPAIQSLKVIQQSLPGRLELEEGETISRGLPDMLIFNDDGWALVIESKVDSSLTKSQLNRHIATVEKCGFNTIYGLSICVQNPPFDMNGWKMITWKELYSWANQHTANSQWAKFMVDFFNVSEAKMANNEYLKEGTITEFSGISFDPFTYLEGKRILRLLTQKIRADSAFIKDMRLNPKSGRSAISNQQKLWDFVSFIPPEGQTPNFQQYPHCTVAINEENAEAMITFPNGMSTQLRKVLHGGSKEVFEDRLNDACDSLINALDKYKAYRPIVRLMQRRYESQRSMPIMDGRVDFDLRALRGNKAPKYGPPIKAQPQWAQLAYDLLANKRSNIQFQIGVEIFYDKFNELNHKNADHFFISVFRALKPFAGHVVS